MITKKQIQGLDFEKLEDYFDYIIERKVNGQGTQARELFNELSRDQKRQFFEYVETLYYYDAQDSGEGVKPFIKLFNFFMHGEDTTRSAFTNF
jgi:hypothetical protein